MPRIDQMFAFVVAGKDEDDEGVLGMMKDDRIMPLVGASMDRIEGLRPKAQEMANMLGKPVKVLKFSKMEVVEVLEPKAPKGSI